MELVELLHVDADAGLRYIRRPHAIPTTTPALAARVGFITKRLPGGLEPVAAQQYGSAYILGSSSAGRAAGSDPAGRPFEPDLPDYDHDDPIIVGRVRFIALCGASSGVAQLVEQRALNATVAGSNPASRILDAADSGPKGREDNQARRAVKRVREAARRRRGSLRGVEPRMARVSVECPTVGRNVIGRRPRGSLSRAS